MRIRPSGLLPVLLLLVALPLGAAQKKVKPRPKAKTPQVVIAELKAQVKSLTTELEEARAEAKAAGEARTSAEAKVEAGSGAAEELASAKASRDLARQETERFRRELESLKASLAENRSGEESLLKQIREAQTAREAAEKKAEAMKTQLDEATARLAGDKVGEGSLVPLAMDITAARPINLSRVTPTAPRGVNRGVVVVNVLVSEKGDALEVRLLQGLPEKESEAVKKAHDLCLDAAKRLVFDPARAADGKTRVKVWQGVGFYLD